MYKFADNNDRLPIGVPMYASKVAELGDEVEVTVTGPYCWVEVVKSPAAAAGPWPVPVAINGWPKSA